ELPDRLCGTRRDRCGRDRMGGASRRLHCRPPSARCFRSETAGGCDALARAGLRASVCVASRPHVIFLPSPARNIKFWGGSASGLACARRPHAMTGSSSTKGRGRHPMALTPEERGAISDLFARVQANGPADKDAEAEALINQLMRRTPDSAYI